ncbi:MAG: hypothetical protein RJB13_1289 [Pseudomonadota bacterium]
MAGFAEDYQQLPPIVKLLVGMTICALAAFYLYTETIEPRQITLSEKQEKLTNLEEQLKSISVKIVTPISLEEELAKSNREFKKILEQLPSEPSIEKILNEFASISRLTGTEIQEFVPANERKEIRPVSQPNNAATSTATDETNSSDISLKMSGTFTSIVSFLDMAMTIPRVIRMGDFEIKNQEKELKLVQRPKLEFTGNFVAYFQKYAANKVEGPVAVTEDSETTNKTENAAKGAIDLNGLINKTFSAK